MNSNEFKPKDTPGGGGGDNAHGGDPNENGEEGGV
jgi:hypothetical protein